MTKDQRRCLVEPAPAFGIDLLDEAMLAEPDRGGALFASMEALDVIGIEIEVLAKVGGGARDPVLLRSMMLPGSIVPVHRHAEVLEARLDDYVERNWTLGGAGALLSVPGDALHALRNAGATPARAICVTTVPLLRFFRDVGAPVGTEPPGPPSMERMERLVAVAVYMGRRLAARRSRRPPGSAEVGPDDAHASKGSYAAMVGD